MNLEKSEVVVEIHTEKGCDPLNDEYSLYITSFKGNLSIQPTDADAGVCDISMIRDCLDNHFDFSSLPEEGVTTIKLSETGEWDPHPIWNKYYQIDEIKTGVEFIDPEPERELSKPFSYEELHMHFDEIEESIEDPFPHIKAYRVRGGFSDIADLYFANDHYTVVLDNYPLPRKKLTSWIPLKTFKDFTDDMKRVGIELNFVPEPPKKEGGHECGNA